MNRIIKYLIVFSIALSVHIEAISQDFTLNVNPSLSHQKVVFGGDGKLIVSKWVDGNVSASCQTVFGDMKLEILRIPIFALQDLTDPVYDDVITLVKEALSVNSKLKIFASIANGDGYGVNYHGAEKFPSSWTGCCSYNVYSLNITTYAAYLDGFMSLMTDNGITIDYLGPYNEDAADDSDYSKTFDQMNNLGATQRIGLERWALATSVADVDDLEDQCDIIGSHFYDDATLPDGEETWGALVEASSKPVWYTESTRYSYGSTVDLLIAGMNNIFPAIRGGAESVIFYQVVPRICYYNGNGVPKKYTAFKSLVNNSYEKPVVESSATDADISVVAFADDEKLSIHAINLSTSSKSCNIVLNGGFNIDGIVTRSIWTSDESELSNTVTSSNNTTLVSTMPANSYVHFDIPIVDTNSPTDFNDDVKVSAIRVYPNPVTNGVLTFEMPDDFNKSKSRVKIIDINGQTKIDVPIDSTAGGTLNVEALPIGIYYVRINTEKSIFTSKIIIQ